MREDDTGLHPGRVLVRGEIELSDVERAHARRVHERVVDEIRAAGGWLSFERFMEIALYEPGLGYYSAGARKFGAGGDFITAPEISALFGACLARQCAQVLESLGGGCILELGPGSGRLAVDLLRELERLERLPGRYLLLETSADLIERQRALIGMQLPHLLPRCTWLDAPPPQRGLRGVILANEVLDALPVRRFRRSGGGVVRPQAGGGARCYEELGVTLSGERFAWAARAADAGVLGAGGAGAGGAGGAGAGGDDDGALEVRCRALAAAAGPWPQGYESEFCPRLPAFTRAVTAALERGVVLWIDYGLPCREYYAPQRLSGTLVAHFRHRAVENPLEWPGLMDISAWVDFTALAEASEAAQCELVGYTTQTYFLAALGIDELIAQHAGDERARVRAAGEAQRLLLPGEMGERFKVMAWARDVDLELHGFRLKDLRHLL